jgi:hypothetical protein
MRWTEMDIALAFRSSETRLNMKLEYRVSSDN